MGVERSRARTHGCLAFLAALCSQPSGAGGTMWGAHYAIPLTRYVGSTEATVPRLFLHSLQASQLLSPLTGLLSCHPHASAIGCNGRRSRLRRCEHAVRRLDPASSG